MKLLTTTHHFFICVASIIPLFGYFTFETRRICSSKQEHFILAKRIYLYLKQMSPMASSHQLDTDQCYFQLMVVVSTPVSLLEKWKADPTLQFLCGLRTCTYDLFHIYSPWITATSYSSYFWKLFVPSFKIHGHITFRPRGEWTWPDATTEMRRSMLRPSRGAQRARAEPWDLAAAAALQRHHSWDAEKKKRRGKIVGGGGGVGSMETRSRSRNRVCSHSVWGRRYCSKKESLYQGPASTQVTRNRAYLRSGCTSALVFLRWLVFVVVIIVSHFFFFAHPVSVHYLDVFQFST